MTQQLFLETICLCQAAMAAEGIDSSVELAMHKIRHADKHALLRRMTWAACRIAHGATVKECGRLMGGRDHSTVCTATERHYEALQSKEYKWHAYQRAWDTVCDRLGIHPLDQHTRQNPQFGFRYQMEVPDKWVQFCLGRARARGCDPEEVLDDILERGALSYSKNEHFIQKAS